MCLKYCFTMQTVMNEFPIFCNSSGKKKNESVKILPYHKSPFYKYSKQHIMALPWVSKTSLWDNFNIQSLKIIEIFITISLLIL